MALPRARRRVAPRQAHRTQPLAVVFYLSPSADTPEGWWAEIGDLQLERGNVATAYKPHIHDLDYIAEALRENTTIEGGMILSSLIRLGYTEEDAFKVMSGLSGLHRWRSFAGLNPPCSIFSAMKRLGQMKASV